MIGGVIYRLITRVVAWLLYLPFSLHQRGRIRLRERYGDWQLRAQQIWWFHGASAGEIAGLLPIIERCRAQGPNRFILVTATSPTGLERVGDRANAVRLLPFDHPCFLSRALAECTVERMISAETELWPELARFLHGAGVPLFLVNARIMERSARWYRRMPFLITPVRVAARAVLAADNRSADRFRSLGFAEVSVVGNAKYDLLPRHERVVERSALSKELGWEGELIVVLGSLRPGEEQVWFPAILSFVDKRVRFVVAPRHREKFEWFASRLNEERIDFARASQRAGVVSQRVLLLDTFGELERYYAGADVAFIGATLVPIGGHNPLEPAMYGVPVLMGPHRSVIQEIAEQLLEAGAAFSVSSADEIGRVLARLLGDPQCLRAAGEAALNVYRLQRGAADRIEAVVLRSC